MQRQFTTDEIPKYSHFAANGFQSNQRQESTRERIKHAFLSAKGVIREVDQSPLRFGYYVIKSITVDWVGHIQLMFPYMRHFEYASQQAKRRLSETSLYEINKWRQDSFVSLSTFKYLKQFIVYWSSETSVSYEEDLSLLLKDVDDVSAQTQDLIRAFSESINFVTSLIQLFDVRQSVTEAINVRRVTYIALVFVPLSWAASIFSMAENYSPGGSQFWIYWVVALPLLIMVFILSNTLPVQVWDRIKVFMFKVTGI
jgi:Mg2+ and Co2+ transporter CorA